MLLLLLLRNGELRFLVVVRTRTEPVRTSVFLLRILYSVAPTDKVLGTTMCTRTRAPGM